MNFKTLGKRSGTPDEGGGMNRSLVVILVAGLAGWACNNPAPVELQQDGSDVLLDLSSISQPDSSLGLSPIDSSALFPEDQIQFAGLVQIARLTFDGGQRVVDTAFTHVLFENRAQPVRVGLRIIGYHGIDLGQVTINGDNMSPVGHRLGRRDTAAGVEYYKNMTSLYRQETAYAWRGTHDTTIGGFTAAIVSPQNLVIHSPRGGSVIRRDRNLAMTWTGLGSLSFVISSYDPVTRRSKPLFLINVKNNREYAVLSSKLLQLLPGGHLYLFTFVLANRKEIDTVTRFSGRVLVQASSVYNSYVELI